MGVGSGYAQADGSPFHSPISFTGWTIVGRDGKLGEPGAFAFNPNAHEPLAATLHQDASMSKTASRRARRRSPILPASRRLPSTLPTKLARHFVADAANPALVARLAKTFRDSDGDLAALARALVADGAAWRAPAAKVRNPC